jgi:predicted nucleic acid-binding protein
MGLIKPPLLVVCDAGPLIHLDELACSNLLTQFQQVLVPHQVWLEVKQHRPTALNQPRVVLHQVSVVISTEISFVTLAQTLGLAIGEQAALSLMKQYPQAILLTDDAAARLAATTLGYQVHGSIGVLLRAIRSQQKTASEIKTILQQIPQLSSLHIRPALLNQIIAQL